MLNLLSVCVITYRQSRREFKVVMQLKLTLFSLCLVYEIFIIMTFHLFYILFHSEICQIAEVDVICVDLTLRGSTAIYSHTTSLL